VDSEQLRQYRSAYLYSGSDKHSRRPFCSGSSLRATGSVQALLARGGAAHLRYYARRQQRKPQGLVRESVFPGLPHAGDVPASGIPITISTPPPSSIVIRSFNTSTQSDQLHAYLPAPNSRRLSTGSSLFFADSVGYDLVAGQVLLPQSSRGDTACLRTIHVDATSLLYCDRG